MDIDPDISRWMLDFLLRSPLDDDISNALIRVLIPANLNSGLTKTALLREIESEVSNGSVSEKTLGLLEKFEQLDFGEGIQASEDLKVAYCAVAVDCTVRFLKNNGDDYESSRGEYFSAVKRIWRQRICKMEKEDKDRLVSEELLNWRDEIEAAVLEDSFCDNVLRRSEGVDAVGAVKVFVKEAKEKMGPSFLESMALVLENKDEQCQIGGNNAALPSASQESTHHNNDREVDREKSVTKKHVGTSRGAKIADSDDLRAEASHKQYDLPDSPEVNKAQEALETSFQELRAVVKDPLPDALHLAATIMCDMSKGNMGDQPIQEKASKPSLMERNSTAHAFEWDDSVDDLPEGSETRPHLPSQERRNISPLKKYEANKLTKRRKIKKWSVIEEDTLRTGVKKYGKGNWKLILQAYRSVFEERNEIDLKDKWRNMMRY